MLRGIALVTFVEVRRHAERDKPSERLTRNGEEQARRVGRLIGKVDVVISSTVGRALETVRAFGCEPGRTDPLWSTLGQRVTAEVPWPSPFSAYQQAVVRNGAAAELGKRLLSSAHAVAREAPEGGTALIVTHGGFPELLAATISPTDCYLASEGPVDYLEGVCVSLDSSAIRSLQVRRLQSVAEGQQKQVGYVFLHAYMSMYMSIRESPALPFRARSESSAFRLGETLPDERGR